MCKITWKSAYIHKEYAF